MKFSDDFSGGIVFTLLVVITFMIVSQYARMEGENRQLNRYYNDSTIGMDR